MEQDPNYSEEQLEELWNLNYKELVLAAKEGLRMPRFVMQAKVAMETRRLIWMTFLMAVATFAMAIVTFVSVLK